jgi:hypothetical protein
MGYRNTKTENWDKLDDLLEKPQRQLRVNEEIQNKSTK